MTDTQDRLVQAAVKLFLEKGYEATTVTEIAGAANVSHMTFFRRFPTKADVIVSNLKSAGFAADVRRAPQELGPAAAALWGFATAATNMIAEDREWIGTATKLAVASDEMNHAIYGPHSPAASGLSEALVARGCPERLATIIGQSVLAGMSQAIRETGWPYEPVEICRRVGSLLLGAEERRALHDSLGFPTSAIG